MAASRPLKIALLLPNLRAGGAEWVNVLLARAFAERGHEVSFLLMQAEGALLGELPKGGEVVDLGISRFRYAPRRLAGALKGRRPDAVIASLWPLTGLAVLARALGGSNCRLVLVEHSNLSRSAAVRGLGDLVNRRLGAFIYGAADAVVAVSQGVKDDLVARTGLKADHVRVIHNPVRTPDPAARADPALLTWWKDARASLIAVGSLKPAKDYPTLLRAFEQLARRRNARILILGEGPARPQLERLVAELGLQERVRLPGAVSDPYPYLTEADLFVLSSAWEGFGNVIVEALAAGTPVVSTDCPSGPAEILENGRYGRLTPVGDVLALARAMDAALETPVDRDMLKARGAEFSVEHAADQYLALLGPASGGRR
jgi:glycosyltransferase involved in cell wall biosynthesis